MLIYHNGKVIADIVAYEVNPRQNNFLDMDYLYDCTSDVDLLARRL